MIKKFECKDPLELQQTVVIISRHYRSNPSTTTEFATRKMTKRPLNLYGFKSMKTIKNALFSAYYLYMAGVAGLEPTLTVLETVALPLNYTPIDCSQIIS